MLIHMKKPHTVCGLSGVFFLGQMSLVFLFYFISFLIRKQDELVKGDGGFQTEVGVSLCLGRIISCGRRWNNTLYMIMIACKLYQSSIIIQNANFTWPIFSYICTFLTCDYVNILGWLDPWKLNKGKKIHTSCWSWKFSRTKRKFTLVALKLKKLFLFFPHFLRDKKSLAWFRFADRRKIPPTFIDIKILKVFNAPVRFAQNMKTLAIEFYHISIHGK